MSREGKRVLVVDDQPAIREMLTAFLAGRGYQVEAASDGEEALELMRAYRPDVVLLDMELPDRNGLDVLRTLRNEGIDTRVIGLSGYESAGELFAADALALGASHFLTKPVDLHVIENAVAGDA